MYNNSIMQNTYEILTNLKNSIHRNLNDKFILEQLNLLHPDYPIILIGGTNGKGSTCEYLTNILISSGLKVGTFTSPHIFEYNERIRINKLPIADEILASTLQFILHKLPCVPTVFSILHSACHLIFKQQQIDVAVIEVGIGGQNDVTNLIHPNFSAITNVSLDHCNILGETVTEIAKEKVGIFRRNNPNFFGNRTQIEYMNQYTQLHQMPLFQLGKDYDFQLIAKHWNYISKELNISNIPLPLMPGIHQLENAALSIAIVNKFNPAIKNEHIISGILATQLPGRFHLVQSQPPIIIDVAHNQDAVNQLLVNLEQANSSSHNIAVFAMRSDKEWETCISLCASYFETWFIAPIDSELSCDPQKIKKCILKFNSLAKITLCDSIRSATLLAVKQQRSQQTIVCFGSFLVAQEAYTAIKKLNAN
ncbi:MAG: Mur ligase family protein, partial [Burkholderiales bacterium]|nr:Mur ligase family protein [Burkholderiales bacterium]